MRFNEFLYLRSADLSDDIVTDLEQSLNEYNRNKLIL